MVLKYLYWTSNCFEQPINQVGGFEVSLFSTTWDDDPNWRIYAYQGIVKPTGHVIQIGMNIAKIIPLSTINHKPTSINQHLFFPWNLHRKIPWFGVQPGLQPGSSEVRSLLQFLAVQLPTWSGEARGALDFAEFDLVGRWGAGRGSPRKKSGWFLIQ